MFVQFNKILPRILLHALLWALVSRILGDVVSGYWLWVAFLITSIGVPYLVQTRLRLFPALLLLGVFPWLLRILFMLVSWIFPETGFVIIFDNSWFLMAPSWYFLALGLYLGTWRSQWVLFEVLVIGLLSLFFLPLGGDWVGSWSAPVMASARMLFSFAILVFGFWALAGNSFVLIGKVGKLQGTKDRHTAARAGRGVTVFIFLLLSALLLSAAFFFHREQSLSEGGGVLRNDLFRFDFNDVLSLEPEITLDSELALLYREDGYSGARYLRRFTLSGWDDKNGFYREEDYEADAPNRPPIGSTLPGVPQTWPDPGLASRSRVRQEYYLITLDPSSFLALEFPVAVEPWSIWDNASFIRAYAVESLVSDAGPWELYDAETNTGGTGNLDEKALAYFTAGDDIPYYINLANEISASAQGAWERAMAIEQWLKNNFYYSLKPGVSPDGDQLRWFLEEGRRGYCSYFAFAMARLCRSIGVPSRVAVGFLTLSDSDILGFFPVGADRAHAWVEVWIDGYGWITFDPTSSTMAPGEEYPIEYVSPDRAISLIEEILTRSGEVSVPEEAMREKENDGPWWNQVLRQAWRGPYLAVVIVLILFILYIPGRILPALRQSGDKQSSSPKRQVIGFWHRYFHRFIRAGIGPGRGETLLEWSHRLKNYGVMDWTEWTQLYLKAMFAPKLGIEDVKVSLVLGKKVQSQWRRLPIKRRLLAMVSPGWTLRRRG